MLSALDSVALFVPILSSFLLLLLLLPSRGWIYSRRCHRYHHRRCCYRKKKTTPRSISGRWRRRRNREATRKARETLLACSLSFFLSRFGGFSVRSFIQNVNVRKYWRKRRKREKCTFRGLFYPLARTRDFLSEKREREREYGFLDVGY